MNHLDLLPPHRALDSSGSGHLASAPGVPEHPDLTAIKAWLNEYKRKANTLQAYAREARRFWLWWSTAAPDRTLSTFKRSDLDLYIAVLISPPTQWVATAESRGWRPFRGPVSPNSRRQALVILQSLFDYLVQMEHLPSNPIRLVRDKGAKPKRLGRVVPSVHGFALSCEWLSARAASVTDPTPAFSRAREAFVWQWIYATGARRHELANATLASVTAQASSAGTTRWWWSIDGKGDSRESVPLNPSAIAALAAFVGVQVPALADHIRHHQSAPLVPNARAGKRGVGDSQVYEALRAAAVAISAAAGDMGLDPDDAASISAARPHSLRAFRATHLFASAVDPRFVQRLMRHADFNTTLIYDHTDADAFYDAVVGSE